MQINLNTPTDQECDAVLTVLIEGAVAYWDCCAWTDVPATDPAPAALVPSLLTYSDPDTGESKTVLVDAELIRKGVAVALSKDFNLNSTDKGRLFATICDDGLSMVDADGADWILQAALFGRLAFG